ncbi:30S ribosomal protein [Raphidocelis subcapitata]|uniref:30S ribosomal protein n=1 Tax=Raphidocelis subcapitata TaxID=307507 RepID=A0A2V0P9A6_9CHLO|nr:30S ribosomal protein [Raphidocelis subcapitata]|eukprot:GBF95532.1 30S ribosomal protein [Raphidocelis subcapitata]
MALLASGSRAMASAARAARPAPLVRPAPLAARSSRAVRAVIEATTAKAAAPVKITIQGRRLEVTPAIRTYVEEKLSRAVHNFASALKRIDVTLSARGGDTGTHGAKQQKVDVTLHTLRHGVVRVEDAEASLYASIDVVCDKVNRKLRKMKERAIGKGTWARDGKEADFQAWIDSVVVETAAFDEERARADELSLARAASPTGPIPDSVLRSKVLRVDRMPVDDAIDAMEAVGHTFFLFRSPESGEVGVVYKRSEGGYGVLIPEAEGKSA